ncbi:MAG: hypothetical protein U0Z17_08555 [Bacteroidales bacterium]
MLPVLSSSGKGSDIMIPMAIPMFGGMLIQVMTIFVVPLFRPYGENKPFRGTSRQLYNPLITLMKMKNKARILFIILLLAGWLRSPAQQQPDSLYAYLNVLQKITLPFCRDITNTRQPCKKYLR